MTFVSAFITLCLVIDPFGSIPVILSLTPHGAGERAAYRRVILREGLIALAVLVIFLLAGDAILRTVHVSQASLGVAGGTVLFMIAIRMIFPRPAGGLLTGSHGRDDRRPLVVPIAIPLIAGPSSMATVMLLAARYPVRRLEWLAALAAAWLVAMVTLLAAPLISRLLGERVLAAVERLMGMILVTVAVEMLLTGIKQALLQ